MSGVELTALGQPPAAKVTSFEAPFQRSAPSSVASAYGRSVAASGFNSHGGVIFSRELFNACGAHVLCPGQTAAPDTVRPAQDLRRKETQGEIPTQAHPNARVRWNTGQSHTMRPQTPMEQRTSRHTMHPQMRHRIAQEGRHTNTNMDAHGTLQRHP